MTFAKVICDSTSWLGKRLVTFHLKYPRYIHSELLTHRVFSKNSGSSRAIPIQKFISKVQDTPVQPLWTGTKNGMQGHDISTDTSRINNADEVWKAAAKDAIQHAHTLDVLGIHKQNVNRLLEPWLHIEVVLTGTEFDNFFELRDHPDAQPEIKVLAQLMKSAMDESKPEYLNPGQWHVPFLQDDWRNELLSDHYDHATDLIDLGNRVTTIGNAMLMISVARCARVSYFNFEGGKSIGSDITLFNQLLANRPLHASPAEHQARVPTPKELYDHFQVRWNTTPWIVVPEGGDPTFLKVEAQHKVGKYVSNLSGWIQLRKLIECGEFK